MGHERRNLLRLVLSAMETGSVQPRYAAIWRSVTQLGFIGSTRAALWIEHLEGLVAYRLQREHGHGRSVSGAVICFK